MSGYKTYGFGAYAPRHRAETSTKHWPMMPVPQPSLRELLKEKLGNTVAAMGGLALSAVVISSYDRPVEVEFIAPSEPTSNWQSIVSDIWPSGQSGEEGTTYNNSHMPTDGVPFYNPDDEVGNENR